MLGGPHQPGGQDQRARGGLRAAVPGRTGLVGSTLLRVAASGNVGGHRDLERGVTRRSVGGGHRLDELVPTEPDAVDGAGSAGSQHEAQAVARGLHAPGGIGVGVDGAQSLATCTGAGQAQGALHGLGREVPLDGRLGRGGRCRLVAEKRAQATLLPLAKGGDVAVSDASRDRHPTATAADWLARTRRRHAFHWQQRGALQAHVVAVQHHQLVGALLRLEAELWHLVLALKVFEHVALTIATLLHVERQDARGAIGVLRLHWGSALLWTSRKKLRVETGAWPRPPA